MSDALPQLVSKIEALAELVRKTGEFVRAAKAPATLRAYRSDWRDFEAWCCGHQQRDMPAPVRIAASA